MNALINKEVWFNQWGMLYHGTVTNMEKAPEINDTLLYVKTNIGMLVQRASTCFLSLEECMDAEKEQQRCKADAFKKEIQDKDDLIRFLLSHQVVGEDFDESARMAAEEKAAEFSVQI